MWNRAASQPPPGYRLRLALLLYLAAPLAAVLGLGWLFGLTQFERLAEDRMQEEIELVARAIGRPLSRALEQGSQTDLQESLHSMTLGIERVYGAYVYGKDGDLVAAVGSQSEWPPRIREIAADGGRTGEYGEIGGQRIFSYFVPLTDVGGRITGVLQVTRRRSEFDEQIGALRKQAAGVLLGSCFLMVGVALWGHHHALGKHVRRLASDMVRVERGDRKHRARLAGPQEINGLALSLNSMLDSIQRSENQLLDQRKVQASLEERLRESEKLAAIGGLAAGVAHELGTPLSVADGQAQRVLRRTDTPEASRKACAAIREQVRRMEEIVRQLLDFGRGRSASKTWTHVEDVAAQAARSAGELAAATDTSLEVETGDRGAALLVDSAGLEQAVSNLLRNAMQASPGGRVRLWAGSNAQCGRIVVEDDGPGIPAEARPRIFEPFFTTKPVGQGTGLGLALTHRVVSDSGGSIAVGESELGGARFEISLPAVGGSSREEKPV